MIKHRTWSEYELAHLGGDWPLDVAVFLDGPVAIRPLSTPEQGDDLETNAAMRRALVGYTFLQCDQLIGVKKSPFINKKAPNSK